jgi:hypothetical protein
MNVGYLFPITRGSCRTKNVNEIKCDMGGLFEIRERSPDVEGEEGVSMKK